MQSKGGLPQFVIWPADNLAIVDVASLTIAKCRKSFIRLTPGFDNESNDVLLDALALVPGQNLPSGLDDALKDLESVVLGLLVVRELEDGVHLKYIIKNELVFTNLETSWVPCRKSDEVLFKFAFWS